MSNMEKETTDIWKERTQAITYNNTLYPAYYNTIDKNERMMSGDQWYKVFSKGLPTPQLNIFDRVFGFVKAFLKSSKTVIRYTATDINTDDTDDRTMLINDTMRVMNKKAQVAWENCNIDGLIDEVLSDGIIMGDMCAYTHWDKSIKNGDIKGDFVTERFDPSKVYFGNPNDRRINHHGKPVQPYILLEGRDTIDNLKAEAKENGIKADDIKKIISDEETQYESGDRGKIELDSTSDSTKKATYIIKLEYNREKGTIYKSKSVRGTMVSKKINTMLTIYPVAWSNWKTRSNSYHGQSPITGYIPNQIFINKALAIMMISMMNTSSPKIVYDKTRISNWSNSPSSAIGVNGDVNGVFSVVQANNMSNNVLEIIKMVITVTIEALGGNDVVLGNVTPNNKSAIVQVTKQASIPYANQRENLNALIEQLSYIWLDYMKSYYKDIPVKVSGANSNGINSVDTLDMGDVLDETISVKVDVGESSYYSEPASQQLLDNLLERDKISILQYVKRLPDGAMKDQDELVSELTEEANQMLQQQGVQAQEEQMMVEQEQGNAMEQMIAFVRTLPESEQQKIAGLGEDAEAYVQQLMENPETVRSIRRELEKQQTDQQIGKQLQGV